MSLWRQLTRGLRMLTNRTAPARPLTCAGRLPNRARARAQLYRAIRSFSRYDRLAELLAPRGAPGMEQGARES